MQLVGLGNTRILTNSAQKPPRTLKGETIYCLHLIQYSQEIHSQRRQPAKTFFFFRSKRYSNTRFAAVQSSWFKKVTKFHTWIQTATPTDCTFQIHVRDSNDKHRELLGHSRMGKAMVFYIMNMLPLWNNSLFWKGILTFFPRTRGNCAKRE